MDGTTDCGSKPLPVPTWMNGRPSDRWNAYDVNAELLSNRSR